MKVRIEKFDRFEYDGGKAVTLLGRSEDKKFRSLVAFGPVGEALGREIVKIAGGVDNLSDIHERKLVVDVEGMWKSRVVKGKRKLDFNIDSFQFLTGPSAELFRSKSRAAEVSAEAAKLHAEGKHEEAYLALEEFVAMFAQIPIPSIDGPEEDATLDADETAEVVATPTDGVDPEAGALERFGAAAPAEDEPAAEVQLDAVVDASPAEVEAPAIEAEALAVEPAAEVVAVAETETVVPDAVVEVSAVAEPTETVEAVSTSSTFEDDVAAAEAAFDREPAVVEEAAAPEEPEIVAASEPEVVEVVAAAPEPEQIVEPVLEAAAPEPVAEVAPKPVVAPKIGGFRPGFRPGAAAGFRPAVRKEVEPEVEAEAEAEAEMSGPRM